MRTVLMSLAIAVATVGALPAPAGAQEQPPAVCSTCPNNGRPAATPEGYYTSVGAALHALNNGGSTSGGPPPCSEEDLVTPPNDGNDTPDHVGHLAYEEPLLSQEFHRSMNENNSPGTYWRRICVFEDGFAPPVSGLISVDFFEEITGANLARYAVDSALARVPAPEVRMSPPGRQLVNVETWLWVDGIATTSFDAPPVSVPGITVTVRVSAGGVYWVMGDGAEFGCDGTGVAYGEAAAPTCSHTYSRSSVDQPDLAYHGSASVRWTAEYWVNGAGPYTVDDAVVRSTPFTVGVAEAQALVTDD
ncbi:MAG: hypothetical protein ACRD0G_11355 [Acidimicrobiales bacterium]